jgi:hypothetical protein
MPQYMSVHRAPGLLPENWDDNSTAIYAAKLVRFIHGYVNLSTGFIFTIYEAPNQAELQEQFEEWGLPVDEIHEVQFSQSFDQMKQRLEQLGRI